MSKEQIMITIILSIGWPALIIFSLLIFNDGMNFYKKLKKTVIGNLMLPSIIVLMFSLYSLGIIATSYMLGATWYYTVIPVFLLFMIAIMVMFISMKKWGSEAEQLQAFYDNLEKLVKKRTLQLEEAHENELKHEKEIQKLKDQFVFIAAHELRTPVTAIKWALETALSSGEKKISHDLKESLDTVQDSNARLIRLIDDILNIARIEAGTIKMEYARFDLTSVIEQTLKEMKTVFKAKEVKPHFDIEKIIEINNDAERVKQILINLLSNATKYNKQKGNIWIDVKKQEDGEVIVSVKDSGIGISLKDLPTLFTQFGRIQTKETKNIEGTGLGLFLCKQIVEQWGGKIYAESQEGKGTTFFFTLPKTPKPQTNQEK